MQKICLRLKGKKNIAVVPTMGFLHEGHLRLVKKAQLKADVVIVTIFINPAQFGKNEDLKTYPRDEKGDLAKLKKLAVDYVFVPQASAIYTQDYQTYVDVTVASQGLCGEKRPEHFRGVATVVLKLLQITQPDYAVFGQKDYQQLVLIKQMVKDLNIPVKIVGMPIIREKDGLAMSSRNAYLSVSERKLALGLQKGLKQVKIACQDGASNISVLKKVFLRAMQKNAKVKVDYIEIVHKDQLTALKKYQPHNSLVAVAVFVGKTRLIDNIVV